MKKAKKNPFVSSKKSNEKNKTSGKRIGKSKLCKSCNQLNRRIK